MQNFVSAATGFALTVALVRAFSSSGVTTVGNVFVEIARSALYVLLRLAFVAAVTEVGRGTPQTLDPFVVATTLEGADKTLALGPDESQIAIKQIGTNGGGSFNAIAAYPFENPNAVCNMLTIWQMIVISTALVFTVGRLVGNKR